MHLSVFIAATSLPTILIGSGILVVSSLIFLYLTNREKRMQHNFQRLEEENRTMTRAIQTKDESIEKLIIEKTKELQEEITHRKIAELERKIALKKAEDALFLKNAFLANMSHEIRTPLNGILGFSSLLLSETDQEKKPDLYEFANEIIASSHRLLTLMEHLIDLSRIDANDYELQLKPFEISTILNRSISKIQNACYEKGIRIDLLSSEEYWALGDKAAFEKVLDLLLDNALKYTETGSIAISVFQDGEKNRLEISIADTGIGIDANFIKYVFEAFRQESTGYSRIRQGAGLGLPLAQKLLHLMNGRIDIESEKGKGTEARLFLDLAPNQNSGFLVESQYESINGIGNTRKKLPEIFIVEDDKMNRMVFEKMLKNNAAIQFAIDGDQAIKQMEQAMNSSFVFDLILLDINLPAPWDGILLLKKFREKWPILNAVPMIAQTAYAFNSDKEKFLALGFDDYISKPISKKDLFRIIENNLRKTESI